MNNICKKIVEFVKNSEENSKLIFINAFGTFLVKGMSLVISLLTIPAYLKYFDNQEVLGLWFTLLSVLSWILTFDLGIGNGLRNYLVPLLVKKDYKEIKKYITSAYLTIGFAVFIVITLGFVVLPKINWNSIFKINSQIISEKILIKSLLLVFISIMLQFFLRLITFILYAMQKSFINNLFNLLNTLLVLIYVSFYKGISISDNLIKLSIVNIITVNIPLILMTIVIFKTELKEAVPNYKFYRLSYAKKILGLGSKFFFIQIMYMLITTTNEFLIVRLASSQDVVEYQIYNRLFSLISILFTIILTPIWSIVTKAISEKNYLWVEKVYTQLKKIAILGILVELIIVLVLQNIVDLWLGKNSILINYTYAIAFAISAGLFIWNGVISSIANGIEKLKTQTFCFLFAIILKIPLSIILVKYFNSWIGIVIANIFIMIPYCIIQPIILDKYIKKMKLKGEENV